MKKINWKHTLATTAFYAGAGAVAGFAGAGAEHSENAAVEATFTTSKGRWAGAKRGAIAGGALGIGLLGAFTAASSRGTTRMIGVGGALLGFGGLVWQINDLIKTRTAEAVATSSGSQQTLPTIDSADSAAAINPAILDAETQAAIDALGLGETVPSDDELLSLTGLGRFGRRTNRRLTHAYSQRYVA